MAKSEPIESVFWAAVGVYALVWAVAIGWSAGWLLGAITAAAYGAGHAYALVYRGKIALSAEPYAMPAAGFVLVASALLLKHAGYEPVAKLHLLSLFSPFSVALFAGHACVFGFVAAAEAIETRLKPKKGPPVEP